MITYKNNSDLTAEVVPEAATGNIEAAKQYPIISEWLAGNIGQRISSYADRIAGADTRLSPARARDIAAGIVSEEYGLEADALSGYQATSGDDPIGKLYDAWTDRNEQQSFRADLVDMTGTRFAEDPETISRYTEIARGGDEIVHNLRAGSAEYVYIKFKPGVND